MKYLYTQKEHSAIALVLHLMCNYKEYSESTDFGNILTFSQVDLSKVMRLKRSRLVSLLVDMHTFGTITLLDVKRLHGRVISIESVKSTSNLSTDVENERTKQLCNSIMDGQNEHGSSFSGKDLSIRFHDSIRQSIENTAHFSSLHYRDINKKNTKQNAPSGAANFSSNLNSGMSTPVVSSSQEYTEEELAKMDGAARGAYLLRKARERLVYKPKDNE